jgi:DNA-binding transcriptional regulator YiaG
LAAVPFGHLGFTCRKPKYISHLWKSEHYPADPRHVGEHIKKRRFDLKLRMSDCRLILGVSKRTLIGWEKGSHKPSRRMRKRIVRFLGYDPF